MKSFSRYLLGVCLAVGFAVPVGWNKGVLQILQAISILLLIGGTYLITKVTFVDFMIREYKDCWEKWRKPSLFFKVICAAYFIKLDDLEKSSEAITPDLQKFRSTISFDDPFRGFFWIAIGSAIQLILIFL